MPDVSQTADVIIVGGGSAGVVLAARLSQDPARTVLLLEAGPAYDLGAYPPALLDANTIADPAHDWGYTSRACGQAQIPTPRGQVVGGSSGVGPAADLTALGIGVAADLAVYGHPNMTGIMLAEHIYQRAYAS